MHLIQHYFRFTHAHVQVTFLMVGVGIQVVTLKLSFSLSALLRETQRYVECLPATQFQRINL